MRLYSLLVLPRDRNRHTELQLPPPELINLSPLFRTSLYAQALYVGEGKRHAPTLQETLPRSLPPLPDRLPLPR